MLSSASSAVVGSPAGRQGQLALPAHQVKNALSMDSKPTAWPWVIWVKVSAGSMTPSSTMALMWVGNSEA